MQIYPAIDLKNNQCVRLYQGQFSQVTAYHDDPCQVAMMYAKEGATWLHVVDLDAAQQNNVNHLTLIEKIAHESKLNLQVGGGIRNLAHIKRLLNAGIKRVIIGSLAVKQPFEVKNWLTQLGSESIVIALDVFKADTENPLIAIQGWQESSETSLWKLLDFYQNSGLKHVICTDISKDGTLLGPNLNLYQTCLKKFPNLILQASGGISQLSDLKALDQIKLSGVIIGKALYEKRFSLKQALNWQEQEKKHGSP